MATSGWEPGGQQLVARTGSVFSAAGPLTPTGQLDSVPTGDPAALAADPWGAERDGDRVLGRGTSDMKSGVAPELGEEAVVRLVGAAVALHDHTGWPRHDPFGAVTANVGVLEGGVQPNVVPDAPRLLPDRWCARWASRVGSAASLLASLIS